MAAWIVDTDGGVDDAQAVVLALSRKENFNVVAITTVAGNIGLQQATKNIAECLRVCNRSDVPLIPGASQPLLYKNKPASEEIHGVDGLCNYWARTYPSGEDPSDLPKPKNSNAAMEIIRLSKEYEGQLGIVTIGPLTNLAIALCMDEGLAGRIARVVVMGGSPTGNGNVTVSAEFNVWSDPEAASIVFARVPLLELVTWELCIDPRHGFDKEWTRTYMSQNTPAGKFIGAVGGEHVYMCDPIALAVAMHPEVVLTSVDKEGWVEMGGTLTRGMTVVNWEGSDEISVRTSTRRNLRIIQTIDMTKVKSLFLSSVSD